MKKDVVTVRCKKRYANGVGALIIKQELEHRHRDMAVRGAPGGQGWRVSTACVLRSER